MIKYEKLASRKYNSYNKEENDSSTSDLAVNKFISYSQIRKIEKVDRLQIMDDAHDQYDLENTTIYNFNMKVDENEKVEDDI